LLLPLLARHFVEIVDGHVPPPLSWFLIWVIWIQKVGKDAGLASNWRPIGLMSSTRKAFTSVLLDPLRQFLSYNAPSNFFGFLQFRSTLHAIFILDELIRRYKSMQRRSLSCKNVFGRNIPHLAVIPFDLEKAFDKQSRDMIWHNLECALSHIGITLTVKRLHGNIQYVLTSSAGQVEKLQVDIGVVQGGSEGPLLFVLCFLALWLSGQHERQCSRLFDGERSLLCIPGFWLDVPAQTDAAFVLRKAPLTLPQWPNPLQVFALVRMT